MLPRVHDLVADGPRMGMEDGAKLAQEESVAPVRGQASTGLTAMTTGGGYNAMDPNLSMLNPPGYNMGMDGYGPGGYMYDAMGNPIAVDGTALAGILMPTQFVFLLTHVVRRAVSCNRP